jgi:hypothetical protein
MTMHDHQQTATIAELLEDARLRRGFTRMKATRMIDTTELTYRQWTRGQMPGVEWADTLAEFCQVSRYTILAAMGILTAAEAQVLDRELGDAIPGYRVSPTDNVVVPLAARTA